MRKVFSMTKSLFKVLSILSFSLVVFSQNVSAQTLSQQRFVGNRILRYCYERGQLTYWSKQRPLLVSQRALAKGYPVFAGRVASLTRAIASIDKAIARTQEYHKKSVFDSNHDGAINDLDASTMQACLSTGATFKAVPGCGSMDFNLDGNLDQADQSIFSMASECYRTNFPN